MRFIDPDGRDEWEINEKEQVVNRIATDQLYITSSFGESLKIYLKLLM